MTYLQTFLISFSILAVQADAQSIFDADFENGTPGSTVTDFDEIRSGVANVNTIYVEQQSVFPDGPSSTPVSPTDNTAGIGNLGNRAVNWLDTDASTNNFINIVNRVSGNEITDDFVIKFDFMKVSGDSSPSLRMSDSGGTEFFRLDIANGGRILDNGAINPTATGEATGILEYTSTNKWISFEITTDFANDTYDIDILRQDRTSVKSYSNIAFKAAASNADTIRFVDFTPGTGDYYFDNISLGVVPEPSTYALIFGIGALSFAFIRKRR